MVIGCVLGAAGTLATAQVMGPHVSFAGLAPILALAGIGFGMAVVPVTSSVLNVVPAERSGMAASATNTSREMGAVLGVAVLGALVTTTLTTKLVEVMKTLHIPSSYQGLVITYVTSGQTPSSIAGISTNNPLIKALEAKITAAAYHGFLTGLRSALLVAGIMLALGAVIGAVTVRTGP